MKKEIVIVIIIITLIVAIDTITHINTKNSFAKINNRLEEIKKVAESIEDDDEKKQILDEKLEEMKREWSQINEKAAFYTEHDELEKVNTSMVKFIEYFKLEEYTEAIPELEACKYILEHIKDKEAMKLINLF